MAFGSWLKKTSALEKRELLSSNFPLLLIKPNKAVEFSESGFFLAKAYEEKNPQLKEFLDNITIENLCHEDQVIISDAPLRAYWLAGISYGKKSSILLIGRDITDDKRYSQALSASNDLFRDLLSCSADFGWETDETGALVYLGPGTALGWNGRDVTGEDAWHLLCPSDTNITHQNPFIARERETHRKVEMINRLGEKCWMDITCVPKTDHLGRWVGTRGVCRDVSEEHRSFTSVQNMQARMVVLNNIITAMRTETGADGLLLRTTGTIAEVMRTNENWIVQPGKKSLLHIGTGAFSFLEDEILKVCHASRLWKDKKTGCATIEIQGMNMQMLMVTTEEGDNAAIVIARDTQLHPWRDYEIELLNDTLQHLSLALKQASLFELMEKLSNVDELTGLFNRRAFSKLVDQRIKSQKRNKNLCCLLYIDLDNFKGVNDTLGHAAGDKTLSLLGEKLTAFLRAEDIAGRLGGDEFAVWLENTGPEGGLIKAESIISLTKEILQEIGGERLNFGMSIGIAVSKPDREYCFDDLSVKADEALYDIKRKGKGRAALAD